MQLIQIGTTEPKAAVTIRDMFEQMATREGEMIRAARQKMSRRSPSTRAKEHQARG